MRLGDPLTPAERGRFRDEIAHGRLRLKMLYPESLVVAAILSKIDEEIDEFLVPIGGSTRIRSLAASLIDEIYQMEVGNKDTDPMKQVIELDKSWIPEYITRAMFLVVDLGNIAAHIDKKINKRKDPDYLGYHELQQSISALFSILDWYPQWKIRTAARGLWGRILEFPSNAAIRICQHYHYHRGVRLDNHDGTDVERFRQNDTFWIEINIDQLLEESGQYEVLNYATILVVDETDVYCLKPHPRISPDSKIKRSLHIPDKRVTNQLLRFETPGMHFVIVLLTHKPFPDRIYVQLEISQRRSFLNDLARHLQQQSAHEWRYAIKAFSVF
jgi:hypothetical protein